MRALIQSLLFIVLALSAGVASAYTPENGIWWNPAEGGTGLQIETQDNLMVVTVYAYDPTGNPAWYTATNFLSGNALFEANLDAFRGGACVGCAFRTNTELGPAGTIRIVFNPSDPTRASMTWKLNNGPERTVPIERYPFYLKRFPEDGDRPLTITKMLGEWHVLFDFADNTSNTTGVTFFGDVLTFDSTRFDNDRNRWDFEGCRPDNSLAGFCSNNALNKRDAYGFYDTAVGRHVIVVNNNRGATPATCTLYDVQVGTDYFSGGLTTDHNGASGGVTVYPCGNDPFTYEFYPVRGYRGASRTFVQEGAGPSKAATANEPAAAAAVTHLPLSPLRDKPLAMDEKTHAARLAAIRDAEAQLDIGDKK